MSKRGRPNSGKNRKTVGLSVEEEAWDALKEKAQAMGMTRSDLVEAVARGEINLERVAEKQLLGEHSAS